MAERSSGAIPLIRAYIGGFASKIAAIIGAPRRALPGIDYLNCPPMTDNVGMKRVIVTPGGRKSYLDILLRYLVRAKSAGEFDRWILWVNTQNIADMQYMQSLADFYDFIEIRKLTVPYEGSYSIHSFFAECVDEDTVYVRLDDDIIFIEPGAIDQLIQFRLANPQYFLVVGNIVNNAILSYIHQHLGAIGRDFGNTAYSCLADLGWKRPAFAHYVHMEFLKQLKAGNVDAFRFPRWILQDFERVSINVISWLGSEFRKFGGKVDRNEEPWLTVDKPKSIGKRICIYGEGLFSHYAFYSQRPELDWTDILQRYAAIAPRLPDVDATPFVLTAARAAAQLRQAAGF
jgi:hypothetical protein